MKHVSSGDNRKVRRAAFMLWAMVLILGSATAQLEAQSVPPNLHPPAGHVAFLQSFAVGTQNYMCLLTDAGPAWTFLGPQATLFNRLGGQIMTHFVSPNPHEGGAARATWQTSFDTSAVWASAIVSSSDPIFVDPNAIPWLLLQVVGRQAGPTAGHSLARTTYVQRLNTSGGLAPATGCSASTDLGSRTFVNYRARYVFYTVRTDR